MDRKHLIFWNYSAKEYCREYLELPEPSFNTKCSKTKLLTKGTNNEHKSKLFVEQKSLEETIIHRNIEGN